LELRPVSTLGSREVFSGIPMAKEIDFPPVWLAGFAALGGVIGRVVPVVTPVNDELGAILIFAGLTLMIVAAGQMLIARTSVIPRRDPDAFVHGGVFRLSRNPIYLADAILLRSEEHT